MKSKSLLAIAIFLAQLTALPHTGHAATPEQAGTYAGTVQQTDFDGGTGKKIKQTSPLILNIQENNTMTLTYGNGDFTSDYNPVYATGGGFRGGNGANGYVVSMVFDFKGKGAIKGTLTFVSPYGATLGKVGLKKVIN